jgi:hypothetical protein
MKYYVYALLDPRKPGIFSFDGVRFDFEPFYVGKGSRSRVKWHVAHARRNPSPMRGDHKGNKIRKILGEGLVPVELKVFSDLTEEEAFSKEVDLIALIGWVGAGGTLTNQTLGGEGPSGAVYTEERRAKLRKPHTEESKAKMREACKNRIPHKHTPESKEKIMVAMIGREISEYSRSKVIERNTGRVVSPESREKSRQSNLGKTRSAESREKMSVARNGVAKSNSHVANQAAAQRGKPRPQVACQHCGLMSSHGNIQRWHGDNCKNKRSKNAEFND